MLTFFLFNLNLNATPDYDTLIIRNDNTITRITSDLDSLCNSWYVKLAIKKADGGTSFDSMGYKCSDSVYAARINKINSVISLKFNSIIQESY